jgi:BASS family bile acid:Na+ symporter
LSFLTTLQNLFTLAFVVTSMLSMGLSLRISQILQPLRSTRLVLLALATNFLIAPAAAFALSKIFLLDQGIQIGLCCSAPRPVPRSCPSLR